MSWTMTGAQARAARALIGWPVEKVAAAAGLPAQTVVRFEAEDAAPPEAVAGIKQALEDAGVAFVPENGGGAGVRLREGPEPKTIAVEDLNASNDE